VDNEQREFWSKVAQKYDQVVDLQIGPKTRSMVRERLMNEDWFGSLAEFGCGTGFYTAVLAGKADHVEATDLSPGHDRRCEGPHQGYQRDVQDGRRPKNVFP
jgi:ubiquinone/menaquinone biosynthesis C-methylase UbiE